MAASLCAASLTPRRKHRFATGPRGCFACRTSVCRFSSCFDGGPVCEDRYSAGGPSCTVRGTCQSPPSTRRPRPLRVPKCESSPKSSPERAPQVAAGATASRPPDRCCRTSHAIGRRPGRFWPRRPSADLQERIRGSAGGGDERAAADKDHLRGVRGSRLDAGWTRRLPRPSQGVDRAGPDAATGRGIHVKVLTGESAAVPTAVCVRRWGCRRTKYSSVRRSKSLATRRQ